MSEKHKKFKEIGHFSYMGTIISTEKRDDDKINLTIGVTKREALNLKGEMENIVILADNNISKESKISKRGNKDATKYFLIPKELRENLRTESVVKCQRLDVKGKTYFVYLIDQET